MIIKLMEKYINDAEWRVNDRNYGELIYHETKNLPEILSEIANADSIESYEGDLLTGKWTIHSVHSIERLVFNDEDGTRVKIEFEVTTINQSAEAFLQTGIDESVDGIMELAELYSELENAHAETQRQLEMVRDENERISRDTDQKQNDINAKYNETKNETAQFDRQIGDISLEITRLQDRINALPTGIVERIAQIENAFNVLADRVAELENKGEI